MPDIDGHLTENEVIYDGVVWEVREQTDGDWLCESWIDDETECPEVATIELHHWGDEDFHCTLALCEKHFEELTKK